MNLIETSLAGLLIVEQTPHIDDRGSFVRWFCADALRAAVGARSIVQINHSRTHMVGAVRGMHYQTAPHAEMKLVRCIRGRVWDVALDLRAGSSTFLRWHAVELSAENGKMLVIPEGFAHAFQVLEPDSELLYLHTAPYAPGAEGGIHPEDPAVAVKWPLPPADLSARDRSQAPLVTDFLGISV